MVGLHQACHHHGGLGAPRSLQASSRPREVASAQQAAEVRGCFFTLDAESFITVDAEGWLVLLAVPTMEVQLEVRTRLKVMCGDLAPSGAQIALGCEDGCMRFVAVEGFEGAPLVVTAMQNLREQSSMLDRFLGKTRLTLTYTYTCPSCRQSVESNNLPTQTVSCPRCRRHLRISSRVPQLQSM